MLPQRKKLIIIVVLALTVGVVIVAVASGGRNSKDPYLSVCDNLIAAIAKKDFDAGYALLSSSAKKADTLESWKEKTSVLGNVYNGADITTKDGGEVATPNSTEELGRQVDYTIKHPAAKSTYVATCIATSEDSGYAVDGFANHVQQADTE